MRVVGGVGVVGGGLMGRVVGAVVVCGVLGAVSVCACVGVARVVVLASGLLVHH